MEVNGSGCQVQAAIYLPIEELQYTSSIPKKQADSSIIVCAFV